MHLKKQGFLCTIYEQRPDRCKNYKCSWLRGLGARKDRPGTCGVLIDRRHTKWGDVLVAKPLWQGAEREAAGRAAIMRAAKANTTLTFVTAFADADRIIGCAGDTELVKEFQESVAGQKYIKLEFMSAAIDEFVSSLKESGQWPAM